MASVLVPQYQAKEPGRLANSYGFLAFQVATSDFAIGVAAIDP